MNWRRRVETTTEKERAGATRREGDIPEIQTSSDGKRDTGYALRESMRCFLNQQHRDVLPSIRPTGMRARGAAAAGLRAVHQRAAFAVVAWLGRRVSVTLGEEALGVAVK